MIKKITIVKVIVWTNRYYDLFDLLLLVLKMTISVGSHTLKEWISQPIESLSVIWASSNFKLAAVKIGDIS